MRVWLVVVVVVIGFDESHKEGVLREHVAGDRGGVAGHDADGMSGQSRSLVRQDVASFDHFLHYSSVQILARHLSTLSGG
jgi:hypothetical protein